jgi:hypothetical protein
MPEYLQANRFSIMRPSGREKAAAAPPSDQ